MNHELESIVGQKVLSINMDRTYLTFHTENGPVSYWTNSQCCSKSYFFDFYGVSNLIGNIVTGFEEIQLSPGDEGYRKRTFDTKRTGNLKGKAKKLASVDSGIHTKVYGYRLTAESPVYGTVSAIFSFRNDSNGYYGGSLDLSYGEHLDTSETKLVKDLVG